MSRKQMHIEIIAPSSSTPDRQVPEESIHFFESKGFTVHYPQDIMSPSCDLYYEANTPEYKLGHFLKALNDDNVDLIMMVRGGYSAAKWAPQLIDINLPKEKMFIGFSDATAIHLVLSQNFGWKTVHGIGLSQAPHKVSEETINHTLAVISGSTTSLSISGLKQLNNATGDATGKLTGGNLSLLQTSIGTSWQLDSKDKIVFIEDIGEIGYKLDRMFEQLIQSGALKGAKAVVLGDFTHNIEDTKPAINHALSAFAKNMEKKYDCPVFKVDNAFGHGEHNIPLVYGADAHIEDGVLHYSW
jgi:muramoyltetrapeptide carboxypeptidase